MMRLARGQRLALEEQEFADGFAAMGCATRSIIRCVNGDDRSTRGLLFVARPLPLAPRAGGRGR